MAHDQSTPPQRFAEEPAIAVSVRMASFGHYSLQRAKQLDVPLCREILDFAAEERPRKQRCGRPVCQCQCCSPHCGRRPAKGNRYECQKCHYMVGKGCCWNEREGTCHRCVIMYVACVPCTLQLS